MSKEGTQRPAWIFAALSFLLLWLSFPPMGLSLLAWISLVPMVPLVTAERLNGMRPYWKIYGIAFVFWLALFYFLPYPHPILILGWIALSAYLAVYAPLFCAVSRTMVHRFGWSPLLAIPIAWTGLEWIRVNFLTGFGMACLSHTQYEWPVLIQISNLFGAYAVTFSISAFSAGVGACAVALFNKRVPPSKPNRRTWHILSGVLYAGVILLGTIGYGYFSIGNSAASKASDSAPPKEITIALIQSSLDTILTPPKNQEEAEQKRDNEFLHRMELTHRARDASAEIDLVVWPESAFSVPDLINADENSDVARYYREQLKLYWDKGVNDLGRFPPCRLLTGTSTYQEMPPLIYNTAALIGTNGAIEKRYFKIHRVMIGEYTPILEYFPALMKRFPVFRNLTAGDRFESMKVDGVAIAPSICFETTVPHLIRAQLNDLAEEGSSPDVMLNITNDGWFFGSSCLDLHFACNVMRAVEMRKPMLVCANTGFSAHIDRHGNIKSKGPRRESDVLICNVAADECKDRSFYRGIGAWVPFVLGWSCVIMMIAEFCLGAAEKKMPSKPLSAGHQ